MKTALESSSCKTATENLVARFAVPSMSRVARGYVQGSGTE